MVRRNLPRRSDSASASLDQTPGGKRSVAGDRCSVDSGCVYSTSTSQGVARASRTDAEIRQARRDSPMTSPRILPACWRATAATRLRSCVPATPRASSAPAQPVDPRDTDPDHNVMDGGHAVDFMRLHPHAGASGLPGETRSPLLVGGGAVDRRHRDVEQPQVYGHLPTMVREVTDRLPYHVPAGHCHQHLVSTR